MVDMYDRALDVYGVNRIQFQPFGSTYIRYWNMLENRHIYFNQYVPWHHSFGQEYANFDIEFPTICGGLVGTWDGTDCDDSELKVKNRYLMPIYNNVLSSSNGRLYNSYGY